MSMSERAFSEYSMGTAANSIIVHEDNVNVHEDNEGPETSPSIVVRQSRTVPQDSALSNHEEEDSESLTCYERVYTRYVLVFFLFMTNFFIFFDRGALTSLITDIRSDKQIAGGNDKTLSETEGGFIVSAYMLGFLVSSPICSALGNVINARWIMICGLAILQSMSFLTGFANSFLTLLLIRVASGLGEAASGAYFMTMVDNNATPKTRTLWIGVYMLAIPLGMALGTALSGYISSNVHMGDRAPWRLAFFISGLGGVPFAIGAMCYPSRFSPTIHGLKKKDLGSNSNTVEGGINAEDTAPLLGADNKHQHAHPWDAVKRLATNKLYMCLVVGMGSFMLIISGSSVVQQPMLRFGPWKMSQTQASSLMAITAIPSVIGSVVGGIVLDKFGGSTGRRGLFRCCRHLFMMGALCTPIMVAAYFVYNIWGYTLMCVVAMMALMSVIAPSSAAMLTSVDKDVRTYAMSYAVMFERAMALPGPTIIGFLADKFSEGCHSLNLQYMCEGTAAPTPINTTTTGMESTTTEWATTETTLFSATTSSTIEAETTTTTPLPYSRSDTCVWVPGKTGANGSCMSEYEDRNAMAFFSAGYIIPVVAWGVAAIITYRRGKVAMAAHAAEVAAKQASRL